MKKIKLVVKNDYDSDCSWMLYVEDLHYLLEGLDVRVENSNTRNTNIVEKVNSYKKGVEYKNYIDVSCKGYSQSDWDDYKIYFDYSNGEEEFDRVMDIASELKKLYTHKNDYFVQQIEVLDSGHEKTLESLSFSIMNIEFPDESDIIYYIDDDLDIEYDTIEFNLN